MSKALCLSKYQASRLPEGYTEVEYIESSGTQYIDTGVTANSTIRFIADVMPLEVVGYTIIGYYISQSESFRLFNANGQVYLDFGNAEDQRIYGGTWAANQRRVIEAGNFYARDITTDEVIVSGATTTSFSKTYTLYINGNSNFAKTRWYACQIYDNGALIRDYVPCINSDSVAGLYDMANGVFYGNAGTGTFAVGESLITGNIARKVTKPYLVMDGVTKTTQKGYVVRENFSRRALPSDYTQVEYIESNGTQYIDTGVAPDNNTRVVMDAQLTTSGSIAVWFGARTSATSNNYAFVRTSSGDTFRSDYNNVYTQTWTADDSVRYVVDKNAETTTFAGTTQSYTNAAFRCPCNMTLFALNQAGTIQWHAVMKLYSCQIYDNGTLVRDYVPCVDASGAAGLYDVSNGIFYGNAGTGAFEIGSTYKNVTRLLYSAYTNPFVSYSGAYTTSEITDSAGALCTLYTLTGSGELVLAGDVQVWMCGGGADGGNASGNSSYGGGGGYVASGTLAAGQCTVTIGARQGTTKFVHTDGTTLSASGASGRNGASGGGGSGTLNSAGTGRGISTYPFNITSLYAHSAGGGGGSYEESGSSYRGGAGGSNGSNGSASGSGGSSYRAPGGTRGGGNGGNTSTGGYDGTAATFYGSGGGGGSYEYFENSVTSREFEGTGGSGYQGVAYVLVPAAA